MTICKPHRRLFSHTPTPLRLHSRRGAHEAITGQRSYFLLDFLRRGDPVLRTWSPPPPISHPSPGFLPTRSRPLHSLPRRLRLFAPCNSKKVVLSLCSLSTLQLIANLFPCFSSISILVSKLCVPIGLHESRDRLCSNL